MRDNFRPDVGLLALIEQAYADPSQGPSEIYAYFRRNGHLLGGDIDATYTTFIQSVLPASEGVFSDPRPTEIRALFARLGIRCQLLAKSAQRRLGIPAVRAALVDQIRLAFPVNPLLGNSLGEVLEQADYQPAGEAYARARAASETQDWTRVSGKEIQRAFQGCTVFTYLYYASWPFYLPAFMTYALRHPVSACEQWTMEAIVGSVGKGQFPPEPAAWTVEQGRSVTAFVAFVASDYAPETAAAVEPALRNLQGRFSD